MKTTLRTLLALTLLVGPQSGQAVVRVPSLAAAKAAGHPIVPVRLPGGPRGKSLDLRLVPTAESLFTARGAGVPQSATFSSSNGPAFKLAKDRYVRIYAGDDARYEAKGKWERPNSFDVARALHEREALRRWSELDAGLVVPVADVGWTAEEGDPDALAYTAFSVPRGEGRLVSGKYVVNELDKPGPERQKALKELLALLPALTERLVDHRIYAPKLDATAVVIDKEGKTPQARLIKARFDDRDPAIVEYLLGREKELRRPPGSFVREYVSDPAQLRDFYRERLALLREQAKMLEDRREGLINAPSEARRPADVYRLILYAAERGLRVRWSYRPEGKQPREETVQLDKKSHKYSGWYKGFVYILADVGAMRRIDRIQRVRLAE